MNLRNTSVSPFGIVAEIWSMEAMLVCSLRRIFKHIFFRYKRHFVLLFFLRNDALLFFGPIDRLIRKQFSRSLAFLFLLSFFLDSTFLLSFAPVNK